MIAQKILVFFFALTISGNAKHEAFDDNQGTSAWIETKEISISMRGGEVSVVLDGKSRHQIERVARYDGCLNFIFKGENTPNGSNTSLLICDASVQLSTYRFGEKHTFTIAGEQKIVEAIGEKNLEALRKKLKFAEE